MLRFGLETRSTRNLCKGLSPVPQCSRTHMNRTIHKASGRTLRTASAMVLNKHSVLKSSLSKRWRPDSDGGFHGEDFTAVISTHPYISLPMCPYMSLYPDGNCFKAPSLVVAATTGFGQGASSPLSSILELRTTRLLTHCEQNSKPLICLLDCGRLGWLVHDDV